MRSRPGAAGGLGAGLRQRARGRGVTGTAVAVLLLGSGGAGAGGSGREQLPLPGSGERWHRRLGAGERPGGTGQGPPLSRERRHRRCRAPVISPPPSPAVPKRLSAGSRPFSFSLLLLRGAAARRGARRLRSAFNGRAAGRGAGGVGVFLRTNSRSSAGPGDRSSSKGGAGEAAKMTVF